MRGPVASSRWRRPRGGRRALLALACAVAGLYCAPTASAVVPSGPVVIPHPTSSPQLSYFKLQARPGSVAPAGTIELLNPTRRPLRVVLAPVDGQTLSTLGSAYAPPGSRTHGPTRWLRLGRRALTLAAGRSTAVPVSVLVPARARPGEHLAGVSIEALHQRPRHTAVKGVSIASVVRYAIGVEVALPGRRHPLIRFTGAQLQREPAGLTFLLLARNPGNVILQNVHGAVRISRRGHTVLARPIPAGTFVSGTSIAYPVPAFTQRPPEGTRYGISAWLRYPGGIARLNTTVTFGHRQALLAQKYGQPPKPHGGTPWWAIALLTGAILYGALTTGLLLRRRGGGPGPPPAPPPGVAPQPPQRDRSGLPV
jgi:hypothetical protein